MRRKCWVFVGFSMICFLTTLSIVFMTLERPKVCYVDFVEEDSDIWDPFNASAQPAQPFMYNLTIVPKISAGSFSGHALVHFRTSVPVSSVFVHLGRDVTLRAFRYSVSRCRATDEARIDFEGEQLNDTFVLEFNYAAPFSVDNQGLYGTKDAVSGSDGLATQFETTFARRVFPCYDTPASKAVFSLSVFAEDGLFALGNTPAAEVTTVNGGRMFKFQDTPVMSPYVLAFAVGKWDVISGYTKGKVPVDVYVPPGQIDKGKFALKFATDSIDFFEDKFSLPYPLPRLQLVSIPDFAAGAMENWGLVTFRDRALLAIDGVTPLSALKTVADTVVHENAHMWAGNLVSPSSWSDVWLNEGFATLLPLICVGEIDARFDGWDDFYRFDTEEAVEFDFSNFTHPVRSEAKTADDAAALFDSISYSKGALVLNMLRMFMGDELFWVRVSSYFKRFAYGHATSDDFVAAMEHSSPSNVKEFMKTWTLECGFPTIYVSRKDGKYHLRQRRLLVSGNELDCVWMIPLRRSDTGEVLQMNETEISVSSTFTTFNDGRQSMAVIEYEEDLLDELTGKFKSLPDAAKWTLLEDLKLLVISSRTAPMKLFKVLEQIPGEISEPVIETAIATASFLFQLDKSTRKTLSTILYPFLNMTRSENESVVAARIRVRLLSFLGLGLKHEKVVKIIEQIGADATEDVITIAMKFRGRTDFAYVRNVYAESTIPQVKTAAVAAMGAIETESGINDAFSMLFDGIKAHELPTLLRGLSENPIAKKRVPKWIEANILRLSNMFGSSFLMQTIIESGFSAIDTTEELEAFADWANSEKSMSAQVLTVGRAREYAVARIKLTKRLAESPLVL